MIINTSLSYYVEDLPKNSFLLCASANKAGSGSPNISIIHDNCSTSFSPGNSGYPV